MILCFNVARKRIYFSFYDGSFSEAKNRMEEERKSLIIAVLLKRKREAKNVINLVFQFLVFFV